MSFFPPNFRLRVPNFYCPHSPAPPSFAYFCRTPFHTRPRLRFCGIFCPLLRRVPSFLAGSFAVNLPPQARQFGCKSPFVRPPFFRLPAAPRFDGFCVSILAGSSLSVTSFRRFWYSFSGSRISSHTLSHRSVTSPPYLLHCCRKFLFSFVGVPVRPIAG